MPVVASSSFAQPGLKIAQPQQRRATRPGPAYVLEQHPFQSGGAAAACDFLAPADSAEAPPRLAPPPAPAARFLDTRMTG